MSEFDQRVLSGSWEGVSSREEAPRSELAHSSPVLILCSDKNGVYNQCLALCEALSWSVTDIVRVPIRGIHDSSWAAFTKRLQRLYATMKIRLGQRRDVPILRIVSSGAASECIVSAYRKQLGSGLYCVFIGSSRWNSPIHDLAILSNHERGIGDSNLKGAKKNFYLSGVLARRAPLNELFRGQPTRAVLIGGVNKAYHFDVETLGRQLASLLNEGNKPGLGMTIVFSRRTPEVVEDSLRRRFENSGAKIVGRNDRSGFEAAMQNATEFFVTPDSITMICEACSSGRPVTLLNLDCINPSTSTANFISEFVADKRVRRFGEAQTPVDVEPLSVANGRVLQAIAKDFDSWCQAKTGSTMR